jgi:ATP-dependent DNA helicase PIF1
MQLNKDQTHAMKSIIAGKNIFVDGPGGVGKSVLVREIQRRFSESTVFLGPTGIAALNINGATFHSIFKFPFKVLNKRDHSKISEKTRTLFGKEGPVKRIVIDEISMVRVDLLEATDQQLRKIRRTNLPFGGLQVIVVGDFFQLPPVVTNKDKAGFVEEGFTTGFCFSGKTWAESNFEHIELTKIMRQTDEEMIENLMNIRSKQPNWEKSVSFFNQCGSKNKMSVMDEDPVFLCSTNAAADIINNMNYEELEEEERSFIASKSGRFQGEPSPYELKLKYGTKIILTANTDDFKNGQVGYVIGFIGNKIEVLLEDTEKTLLVGIHKWEDIEYSAGAGVLSRDVMGTYHQYPMKHGWAITIHKAQGQSINYAMIDLGRGAFAAGQLYVALSRVRTLEGLALANSIKNMDVIVAPEIIEFYENGCRGTALDI